MSNIEHFAMRTYDDGTFAIEFPREKELECENAKLRELAKDIHALATDQGVYVQYPYCDAWDEKLAVAEKQMRELGIEVEECTTR